jgi:hypothetical protein
MEDDVREMFSSHGDVRNVYRIPMSKNVNDRNQMGDLGANRKIILRLH